jgi:DNA repair protein RadA/Sms
VAAALLSAREDVAIPPDMVLFGEISLSGALRPVGQTENRLKEASKLGFSQAVAPSRSKLGEASGMKVRQMPDLTAFVGEMFGAG